MSFFSKNNLLYLLIFPSTHNCVMRETKGHGFNTVNCQFEAGERRRGFCSTHGLLLRCPQHSSVVEAQAGKRWDDGTPYIQSCGFHAVHIPQVKSKQKYMDDYRAQDPGVVWGGRGGEPSALFGSSRRQGGMDGEGTMSYPQEGPNPCIQYLFLPTLAKKPSEISQ